MNKIFVQVRSDNVPVHRAFALEHEYLRREHRDILTGQNALLRCSEDCITSFKTTVWEDNVGALTLANLEPGQSTPRSKFYDVKVHWFRQHLQPGILEVLKIDTENQLADIFTKPLVREIFERLRYKLMGW